MMINGPFWRACNGCSFLLLRPSRSKLNDFRAVDRPLTRNEMAALRSISTSGNCLRDLHKPLRMGRPESQSEQTRPAPCSDRVQHSMSLTF